MNSKTMFKLIAFCKEYGVGEIRVGDLEIKFFPPVELQPQAITESFLKSLEPKPGENLDKELFYETEDKELPEEDELLNNITPEVQKILEDALDKFDKEKE